jgi:hypothetical protein
MLKILRAPSIAIGQGQRSALRMTSSALGCDSFQVAAPIYIYNT